MTLAPLTREELGELRAKLDAADYDWQDVEGLAYALRWLLEERHEIEELRQAAERFKASDGQTRGMILEHLAIAKTDLAAAPFPESSGAHRRATRERGFQVDAIRAAIRILRVAEARI